MRGLGFLLDRVDVFGAICINDVRARFEVTLEPPLRDNSPNSAGEVNSGGPVLNDRTTSYQGCCIPVAGLKAPRRALRALLEPLGYEVYGTVEKGIDYHVIAPKAKAVKP